MGRCRHGLVLARRERGEDELVVGLGGGLDGENPDVVQRASCALFEEKGIARNDAGIVVLHDRAEPVLLHGLDDPAINSNLSLYHMRTLLYAEIIITYILKYVKSMVSYY